MSSDGVGIGKARRRFGVSKRRGSSSCAARWLALATERLLLHAAVLRGRLDWEATRLLVVTFWSSIKAPSSNKLVEIRSHVPLGDLILSI